MRQRVRCPHCHRWTDALLVWASGDCCPTCNAPIVGLGGDRRGPEDAEEVPTVHGDGRISGSTRSRPRGERLGERL